MAKRSAGARPPLQRVLVATDFSEGSRRALRRALLLPLAMDARIHLVHVLPPAVPEKARASVRAEARRRLDREVERARRRARHRELVLTSELRAGQPFVELIRASRDVDAELIVVGRHGRRSIRGRLLGSTVERVIRMGDAPVLAVQLQPLGPYARPVVASDLGDTAPRVIALLRRVLGAEVGHARVVHAFNVPFEGFVAPTAAAREASSYRRSLRRQAEQNLAALLGRFEGAGLRFETTVRPGEPRAVIVEEAERARADLLALGTHGRSGVAHALVGSVAEGVIRAAPCDVLVGRPVRFSFELP